MLKYKNLILILTSFILLIYAGLISIYPAMLTSTFNIDKFEEKVYDATSLVTTIDAVNFKIKPNFDTIITFKNWSSKYIDEQDCFDARVIQITTTPFCMFTKNFKIKDLYLKNVKYANQTLPTGENKLAFLPGAFNAKVFGTKKITVTPGPLKIKFLKVKEIAPYVYEENKKREANYTAEEVKDFLSGFQFSSIEIK